MRVGDMRIPLFQLARQFLCDSPPNIWIATSQLADLGFRELTNYGFLRSHNSRRTPLAGLDRRHFSNMVIDTSPRNSPTIHENVECPRNDKVQVVIAGALFDNVGSSFDADQRSRASDLLGQSRIAGDDFL